MPVECIDWRRFAYGRSSGDSASLPKVPRARRLEDTVCEGEGSPVQAGGGPSSPAQKGGGESWGATAPPGAAADAQAAGTAAAAQKDSKASNNAAPATPHAEPQPPEAALAEQAPASEPTTLPPVRLASLHDGCRARSSSSGSGWLSFGSSSNDRSQSASRVRADKSSSSGKSSTKQSSKSTSSSGGKQQRAAAAAAVQQAAAAPVVKRRKLLRGGVAACVSADSDDEAVADSTTAQDALKGGAPGILSHGRSKCHREGFQKSSSSESESDGAESDEEALDALQLCLQESEAMTDLLVQELGGATAEGRAQVRREIGEGRCHCRASLGIPADLQQHCGAGWERLKDYQKCGVHWLAAMHRANRNGILADEMGLGKTAQTCVFFNFAYSSGLLSTPTLVAAPASLVDNWVRELETWAPFLAGRVVKYAGKQAERRSLALECIESLQGPQPFCVLVASVNSLANKWDVQYLRQLRPFAYLVVDEAHALKNKDSQVYKNINKMARCERRILLTGSPIQNRTGELRNLLLFLMPAVFDAESLDLALTAFERQAHRQRACLVKAKNKQDKQQQQTQQKQQLEPHQEKQGEDVEQEAQRTGEEEQQQERQQEGTEEVKVESVKELDTGGPHASVPDSTSHTNNNSRKNNNSRNNSSSSSEDDALVLGSLGENEGTAGLVENDRKGFLSRAFATLAARGEGGLAVSSLSADVTCLQRVLSPFILRRLKSEVMQELPRKINVVVRCELTGPQKALYLTEVRKHETDLAASLRRLTHAFADENPTDASTAGSAPPVAVSKGEAAATAKGTGGGQTAGEADAKAPDGGGKRFVSSMLFRLRRICNHSLLMQGRYTLEQKDRMAKHYAYHVEGFKGNQVEKVRAEFERWSDYEIHQASRHRGIRMLAEQGDLKLADLALPADAFLESAKLRQAKPIESFFVYSKAFELLGEVQRRGEKALVFSQFTTFLDVVEEALQLHMPTLKFCRLDGSTVVEERQRLVDGFNQTEDCTAFLLSTKAGGQGLNLTAARTVILLDQDWNPQNDRQAEDRVHRLGQTHEVAVYRLCCRGTVEESILKRKLDLDSAFGGNSEILQAAILRDSLESGGLEEGGPLLRV
ncbi:hypothetical protein Esti_005015 [Eimeria stiedai]